MIGNGLNHDQRGATAIEYAIIAGLIGLGLVGSLVTTRGSLSSVFGTASSQIGSSDASVQNGGAGAIASRSAFWDAKTVSSRTLSPRNSGEQMKTVYTDGTSVTYATGQGDPFRTLLMVTDPNARTSTLSYFDAAGRQNYYFVQLSDTAGNAIRTDGTQNPGYTAFDGVPPDHQVQILDTSGNVTSKYSTPVDAAWTNLVQSGIADYRYFKDVRAGM